MKFIVDEMPNSKSKCPFSEWEPYPPIMEEPGHYICKINHNDCNLCETECQLLKEQPEVVQCKECWFGDACKSERGEHGVMCYNSCSANHGWVHEPNWFCADGKGK